MADDGQLRMGVQIADVMNIVVADLKSQGFTIMDRKNSAVLIEDGDGKKMMIGFAVTK